MDQPTRFAQFLTKHRIKQVLVAHGIGVTPQYVSMLARGEGKPSLDTIAALKRYFEALLERPVAVEDFIDLPGVEPVASESTPAEVSK